MMTNAKEENLSLWNSLTAVIERYTLFLTSAVNHDDEKVRPDLDITVDRPLSRRRSRPPPDCYNHSNSKRRHNNICSSKQTNRTKDQANIRSTSLPAIRPNLISDHHLLSFLHRRYASEIVQQNVYQSVNCFSSRSMSTSSSTTVITVSNDHEQDKTDSSLFDQIEISNIINRLIQRVELLETTKNTDDNLIDYLSYLFQKFTFDDDCQRTKSMFDTSHFVHHACQTFVRHLSSSDSPNTNDQQLSETFVREYHSKSNDTLTPTIHKTDQDIWLVVDLQSKEKNDLTTDESTMQDNNESQCLLVPPSSSTSSTADEQFLLANENYFSLEEIKSCGSESSQSNYYSPNSSLVDLQNMVQDFDEMSNNINNNNNTILFNEDRSSTIDHFTSNVISEVKTNPICSRLTNQSDDQQPLEKSPSHTEHSSNTKSPSPSNDRMSRRERKLQERWNISTKSDHEQEHLTNKNLLGVEFPPIAVLRRKFSATSSAPNGNHPLPSWKKDSTKALNQKNESLSKGKGHEETDSTVLQITPTTISNDEIKHEQVIQSSLNDVLSTLDSLDETSSIPSIEDKTYQGETVVKIDQEKSPMEITNAVKQCELDQSDLTMIRTNVTPSSSECLSTNTNDRHEEEKEETTATATAMSVDSFSSAIASLENKNKGKREGEEDEEEREEYGGDDNIVKAEEKDNCSVEVPQQNSESILTNVESMASIEGKDEGEETGEQQQQQQPDKSEPSMSAEPIDEKNLEMINNQNLNEYQRVEIEEIPDDEDILDQQRKLDLEPIDFIRTDDDLPTVQSNSPLKSDPMVPCYEKSFGKLTDVTSTPSSSSSFDQRPEDDPIALRALERFEQRLNASKSESQSISQKGKSSWSGSTSLGPRKSLDNLFKTKSPCESESFIRPRRTIFDDTTNLNCVLTANHCDEEQPKAINENNTKTPTSPDLPTNSTEHIEDQHLPETMTIDTSVTNENRVENEIELNHSLPIPSDETLLNTTNSSDPSLTPYRLQLEGRRRLNTLERLRERRQNLDVHQYTPPPPVLPTTTDYSIKTEDIQDPIIRRALERFDEKNRALSQSRPTNYDDIQDPITRRALMRLESNLKRTMPMTNNDLTHEHSYTNSYTLGSLQTPADQRYARPIGDASLPPPVPNHKPSHVSAHSRFCSTLSNHTVDLPASGQILANGDEQIPIMRVPPNVLTNYPSSNLSLSPSHQISSVRQRSRSEDFISSKELSLPSQSKSDEIEPENPSDEPTRASISVPNEDSVNQSDSSASTVLINNVQSEGEMTVEETTHVQPFIDSTPLENSHLSNDLTSSAFMPVHSSMNAYYSQQNLPTNHNYTAMYTSNNANQIPYTDDPIVRRALERFNCQMQQSMMSMSQYPQMPPMSRPFPNGYGRSGQLESFYAPEQNTPETWTNAYHSMPRPSHHSTGTNSCGYQSIIGRRRQMRQDDMFFDNTSVGNGYSSSLFLNHPSNPPPSMPSHYVNLADEQPPMIPPRYSRENYYHSQDYLSENMNNNNSNHPGFMNNPNLYPAINNGFRPINHVYPPPDAFQPYPDDDYLRHRAQSTSSTTSSDSVNPIRLIHQRLPPTLARTNLPGKKNFVHEQCDIGAAPSLNSTYGNNPSGDSVFHRLAYTGTKSSLSKSSSNLCANLTNKTSLPTSSLSSSSSTTTSNNLKAHDIDFDESNSNGNSPNEAHQESLSNSSKCQRSRSVDGRARLKNAQTRPPAPPNVSSRSHHDYEENSSSSSSKFTSVIQRRESQPPRLPVTPRSTMMSQIGSKRSTTTTTAAHSMRPTPTARTRTSQMNSTTSEQDQPSAQETESDEISSHAETYQPKIIDNRTRTSHSIQRHPASVNGNHLQSSPSTSSVMSTMSRNKVPLPSTSSTQLEGKESNLSTSELNRTVTKRNEENRLLSPNAQRRPVPVSVFAPAKPETKRPAPAPPKLVPSTNDESLSSLPVDDQPCTSEHISSASDANPLAISGNDDDIHMKSLTSMSSHLKSSTGNLLKEFSLPNDQTNLNKKMNVFERLFRGHKKKI